MANILCIETASEYCNVALQVEGQNYLASDHVGRTHNLHLLPTLERLLDHAQIQATQLDCVAFGCGPGSFTGVRLAASATQALALAADAPVLALSSSRLLAHSVNVDGGAPDSVLTSIRSRGDSYYLALWQARGNVREDALYDAAPQWLDDLAGDQGVVVAGELPTWLSATMARVAVDRISASALLEVAVQDYAAGCGRDPEWALPVYLQGDSPWTPQPAT